MTSERDDWSELSQVWTEPGLDPPSADLMRRVRRRHLWGRINFHVEILVALAAAGFVLYAADAWDGGPVMATGGVLFAAFAVIMTVWARRAVTGPASVGTPAEALRSAVRQAEAGFRWAVAGLAITVAAGVFMATFYALRSPSPQAAVLAYGLLSAMLVGFFAFYTLYARRCRRRMARHAAALKELEGEPSDPPPG